MEKKDFIQALKLQLTGGVLNSEISDETYGQAIDLSLKEINQYYNDTELQTIPAGSSCIDLSKYPLINNVVNVYRTQAAGFGGSSDVDSSVDPVYMSQLQMYNFGSGSYSTDWIYRLGTYSTLQQISNTVSTDLSYRHDKNGQKLYVNMPMGTASELTIEYIPKLQDVSQIKSDYWINMLLKLSLAHSKVILGRVRSRYTQSGALWSGDGETILTEGNNELTALREQMRVANDFALPLD